MTSRDFTYWLQGFFELRENKDAPITAEQSAIIQKHLNLVFIHEIDPSFPQEQQETLNEAHHGSNEPAFTMPLVGQNGITPRC